jgi:hypothetical protein
MPHLPVTNFIPFFLLENFIPFYLLLEKETDVFIITTLASR